MIKNNVETYNIHRELLHPMLYMQHRGTRMDVVQMKSDTKKLKNIFEKRQEQLNELVGHDINMNSSLQMKNYFYIEKNIKPYLNPKTHKPSCDKEALKRLSRRGFLEASIILEMRRADKLRNSYLEAKLSDDNRLRSAFGFTRGGRLTASKDLFGEGINMQTLPHPRTFFEEPNNPNSEVLLRLDFREYLLADEGYLLYNIDEAQAENRVVAYIAPDLNMIQAFEDGIDIHKRTAALCFNKPIEEVSTVDGSCSIGDGTRSERYYGKETNHATNYGMGAKTFAFNLEIPESQAQMLQARYLSGYPGVRLYYNWVPEKIRQERMLVNLFGRAYEFFNRIDDSNKSDALYFIPQSTVGDLINRWGILKIWREKDEFFRGLELLNQVHDSIVFQIPISLGFEAHWRMLKELIRSLAQELSWEGRSFSIPSDLSVGLKYGELDELKGAKINEVEFRKLWEKHTNKESL